MNRSIGRLKRKSFAHLSFDVRVVDVVSGRMYSDEKRVDNDKRIGDDIISYEGRSFGRLVVRSPVLRCGGG